MARVISLVQWQAVRTRCAEEASAARVHSRRAHAAEREPLHDARWPLSGDRRPVRWGAVALVAFAIGLSVVVALWS